MSVQNKHGHVRSGGQSSVFRSHLPACLSLVVLETIIIYSRSIKLNLNCIKSGLKSGDHIQWSVSDLTTASTLLLMFKVKTNTPLSGPGILKAVRKRGRKRKINEALSMQEGDEESWENDYRGRLLKL